MAEARELPAGAAAPPRVGVVLAAGRSERIRSVTGGGSKALLRLGGLSLVERAVKRCSRRGWNPWWSWSGTTRGRSRLPSTGSGRAG